MDPKHLRPIAISSYIPPKDPAAYPIPLVRQPSLTKYSSLATSLPEHIAKEGCGRSRLGVLKTLWRKWKEQGSEEGEAIGEENRKKLIFEEDANAGESSGRISTAKRTGSTVDERVLPTRSESNLLRHLTQPRSNGNTAWNDISDATEGNPAEMRRARKTKAKSIERQEMEPTGNKIDNTPYPKPDYSLFDTPFTGSSPYVVSNDLYIPMPHARREFIDPQVEVREFWPVDARYDGRPIGKDNREEKKQEEEAEYFGQNGRMLDSHDNIWSHARIVENDDRRHLASNLDNKAHSYDGLPPRRYGHSLDPYSGLDLQFRCSKSERQDTRAGLLNPFTKHYSLTTSHASDSSLGLPTLSSSSAQSYNAHDLDLDYLMSSSVRSSPEPKTPNSDFIEDKRAQCRIQLLRALVVPRRVGPMAGNRLEESRGAGALGWGMGDLSVGNGDRRDVRRPV